MSFSILDNVSGVFKPSMSYPLVSSESYSDVIISFWHPDELPLPFRPAQSTDLNMSFSLIDNVSGVFKPLMGYQLVSSQSYYNVIIPFRQPNEHPLPSSLALSPNLNMSFSLIDNVSVVCKPSMGYHLVSFDTY